MCHHLKPYTKNSNNNEAYLITQAKEVVFMKVLIMKKLSG